MFSRGGSVGNRRKACALELEVAEKEDSYEIGLSGLSSWWVVVDFNGGNSFDVFPGPLDHTHRQQFCDRIPPRCREGISWRVRNRRHLGAPGGSGVQLCIFRNQKARRGGGISQEFSSSHKTGLVGGALTGLVATP